MRAIAVGFSRLPCVLSPSVVCRQSASMASARTRELGEGNGRKPKPPATAQPAYTGPVPLHWFYPGTVTLLANDKSLTYVSEDLLVGLPRVPVRSVPGDWQAFQNFCNEELALRRTGGPRYVSMNQVRCTNRDPRDVAYNGDKVWLGKVFTTFSTDGDHCLIRVELPRGHLAPVGLLVRLTKAAIEDETIVIWDGDTRIDGRTAVAALQAHLLPGQLCKLTLRGQKDAASQHFAFTPMGALQFQWNDVQYQCGQVDDDTAPKFVLRLGGLRRLSNCNQPISVSFPVARESRLPKGLVGDEKTAGGHHRSLLRKGYAIVPGIKEGELPTRQLVHVHQSHLAPGVDVTIAALVDGMTSACFEAFRTNVDTTYDNGNCKITLLHVVPSELPDRVLTSFWHLLFTDALLDAHKCRFLYESQALAARSFYSLRPQDVIDVEDGNEPVAGGSASFLPDGVVLKNELQKKAEARKDHCQWAERLLPRKSRKPDGVAGRHLPGRLSARSDDRKRKGPYTFGDVGSRSASSKRGHAAASGPIVMPPPPPAPSAPPAGPLCPAMQPGMVVLPCEDLPPLPADFLHPHHQVTDGFRWLQWLRGWLLHPVHTAIVDGTSCQRLSAHIGQILVSGWQSPSSFDWEGVRPRLWFTYCEAGMELSHDIVPPPASLCLDDFNSVFGLLPFAYALEVHDNGRLHSESSFDELAVIAIFAFLAQMRHLVNPHVEHYGFVHRVLSSNLAYMNFLAVDPWGNRAPLDLDPIIVDDLLRLNVANRRQAARTVASELEQMVLAQVLESAFGDVGSYPFLTYWCRQSEPPKAARLFGCLWAVQLCEAGQDVHVARLEKDLQKLGEYSADYRTMASYIADKLATVKPAHSLDRLRHDLRLAYQGRGWETYTRSMPERDFGYAVALR